MSVDIAIYLPSLRGGGAERVMLTLANGIAKRGFTVDVVLASAEGPYLKDVASNVRVIDLGARRVSASLPGLVSYLRRERPRAMLSALNHANVIATVAKTLAGVKTRLLVSEHSNASMARLSHRSLRARVVLPLMRWAYRRTEGVIAVSKGVADDLAYVIGLSQAKISVIYNPVVTQELFHKARAPLQHPWLGSAGRPVILGVGRLTKAKDFGSLIRAFAIVRQQLDCRLVILGEGELRPELEALVRALDLQDSVDLPGFVDNPIAWMSRASVFALSSVWEGLPTVLIEALACGTPVVSTNCPSGPDEILEGGKWGKLVPVGDSKALAKAITDSLACRANREPKACIEKFSEDRCVSAYLRALDLIS